MGKPVSPTDSSYGLKKAVLSGNETIAQSIALIAPTACPLLTVPLVFASAGMGTWLAFLIATITIVLVALNINQFARVSASPGSLYSYISSHMHPVLGIMGAWALLIAYVSTAIAIAAGLMNYSDVLLQSLFSVKVSPLFLGAAGVGLCVFLAYRDVRISARLMLGLEILAVSLILIVAAAVLARHGFHVDVAQVSLKGMTADKLRMGLVLSIFALVGFESATSLGSEARDPLRNIPRAVKWSGILAGLFFVLCAYTEVLGFRGSGDTLDKSLAPMHVLARNAGMPALLGVLIDLGALVSFFSCVLACLTAAARVLFLMGQKGALHALLGQAHASNQTPHRAVLLSGLAVFLPLGGLGLLGIAPLDIYGLLGTLATFGFLTAYILVCIAAPIFLRSEGRLKTTDIIVCGLALLAMAIVLEGSVYPVPPAPYFYLPYIYMGLLLGGLAWSVVLNAKATALSSAELV